MQTKQVKDSIVDPRVIDELFPILLEAAKKEQPYISSEEQQDFARSNAHKLAVVFGKKKSAMDYLARFAKENESKPPRAQSTQVIHDACLFEVPKKTDWDPTWLRGIVAKIKPNGPNDRLMMLPFFPKLQQYLTDEQKQVKAELIEKIYLEEKEKLGKDYDEFLDFQQYFDKNYKQQIKTEADLRVQAQEQFNKVLEKYHSEDDFINQQIDKIISQKNKKFAKPNNSEDMLKLREEILVKEQDKLKREYRDLQDFEGFFNKNFKRQIKTEIELRAEATQKHTKLKERYKSKEDYINQKINELVSAAYLQLLSPNASIDSLLQFSRLICYKNAKQNPDAAALFFKYGISEADFDKYLELKPQDNEQHIPKLSIAGSQLSSEYSDYRLEKLSPSDPTAAVLGKMTSCCQYLGCRDRVRHSWYY